MSAQKFPEIRLSRISLGPIVNGIGEASDIGDPTWPRYIRITDIRGLDKLKTDERMSLQPTLAAKAKVERDDILMAAVGATVGDAYIHQSDAPSCFAGYLVRFRADKTLSHPRYVAHWTQSSHYRHQIRSGYVGSTIENFSASKYRAMRIPLPALGVQREISRFLDLETLKIDALIGKQEELIATLREDRSATITQAVTKGLDSRGGISSSGNQGPPAHWARDVPLKRLAEVQTGLTLGRSVPPETATTLPYLRVANVQVGRVDLTEVTDVEVDRSEVARYRLRAGDVLMTEGGDIDKLGRGCLWQGEINPCLHQNHVFAVRCFDTLDARFLVYLLDTAPAREYFTLTAKKTTNLASTNSTTLGRFSFPVPPIAEQKAILNFLDERCSKIDTLIDKSTEMIDTLREYRSALITNAVTGQLDVPSAPLESANGPINELTKEVK